VGVLSLKKVKLDGKMLGILVTFTDHKGIVGNKNNNKSPPFIIARA
jgi:hypothetical protein